MLGRIEVDISTILENQRWGLTWKPLLPRHSTDQLGRTGLLLMCVPVKIINSAVAKSVLLEAARHHTITIMQFAQLTL